MNVDLSPLWISLKTALTATAIAFFFGIILARFMLEYRGKIKGIIDSVLLSPLVLPPTVVGFILLLLLGKNGALGKILELFNVRVVFTWSATVIAAVVVAFPLMYQTTIGAFKQIDSGLLAAARTLGASESKVFLRVMLPLAKPGLISAVLLTFARALGEFGATLMLAGSIPGQTQTIPVAIYFASEGGLMDQALFWVLLMLAIAFTVIVTMNYWADKRLDQETNQVQQKITVSQKLGYHSFVFQPNHNQPTELIVDIHKKLKDFSLDVSFSTQKESLGLLGGSGAGKSMILRCIAGLETPDRGKIVLNGTVLFDSAKGINLPSRERRVGFLFQSYALFPHLSVAENITFSLSPSQSQLITKQQLEAQLIALDLQGLGDRYPGELSGGQQQRVALARVLASNPEILLFDEPFSALDTYLRDRLEKLLIAILEGFPGVTLFVTHNLEEAYRVCENLMVIDKGKIIALDSKDKIFEHPGNFRTAELTGCKNFSSATEINDKQVRAGDWGCDLRVIEPIPEALNYVMIRAHQINFVPQAGSENTFPCWLVKKSETQHRVTVYIKLNSEPIDTQDYHLQAEVFKEKWATLKDRPFPWFVELNPLRVCLLRV